LKEELVGNRKRQVFANVWDALADTPEEAANLTLRSDLMIKIEGIIKEGGWTQAEAAKRCGVTQPRMNDLLRGRISRFSIDALVNIASALGRKVRVSMDAETSPDQLKLYENNIRGLINTVRAKRACQWCRNPGLPIISNGLCSSCYRWYRAQGKLSKEVAKLPPRRPKDQFSNLRRELGVVNCAVELCKADGDTLETQFGQTDPMDLNDAFHGLCKRVLGATRGAHLFNSLAHFFYDFSSMQRIWIWYLVFMIEREANRKVRRQNAQSIALRASHARGTDSHERHRD
jgi:predicted XRE-type DNA-binding protein